MIIHTWDDYAGRLVAEERPDPVPTPIPEPQHIDQHESKAELEAEMIMEHSLLQW